MTPEGRAFTHRLCFPKSDVAAYPLDSRFLLNRRKCHVFFCGNSPDTISNSFFKEVSLSKTVDTVDLVPHVEGGDVAYDQGDTSTIGIPIPKHLMPRVLGCQRCHVSGAMLVEKHTTRRRYIRREFVRIAKQIYFRFFFFAVVVVLLRRCFPPSCAPTLFKNSKSHHCPPPSARMIPLQLYRRGANHFVGTPLLRIAKGFFTDGVEHTPAHMRYLG